MYHAVDAVLLRAAVRPPSDNLPPWPDLEGDTVEDVERWRRWVGEIWADEETVAALEVASPALVDSVQGLLAGQPVRPRAVRRLVLSLMRYLLRMRHRATPFGLFAGVAPARIGDRPHVRRGGDHRAFTRADAEWLDDVITMLERDPELVRRLRVVADTSRVVRGHRITVPHRPGTEGPTEVTLRRTPPVETLLDLASTPVSVEDIVGKLLADHPGTPVTVIEGMVAELIASGLLITSLRAPMTCDDALGQLVAQLSELRDPLPEHAAATAAALGQVHRLLTRHDTTVRNGEQRALRAEAVRRMTALCSVTERPVAVHLRANHDVVLPEAVAREAESALEVMARISPFPAGPPAWQDYRVRFLERYSMGALVPLRDLVDPDIGLGFPAGYRASVLSRPVLATTLRDEHLLALAQRATAERMREITLTEEDLTALTVGDVRQAPAHLELCFSVQAPTLEWLRRGRFTLSVSGLSQSAGTMAGRFLPLLERPDADRMASAYAALPTLTAGAERVQVSGPPLRRRIQNVGRAPAVLPLVLSLGEHEGVHGSGAGLDLDDLAVTADSQRLYLVSLSTGAIVEPSVMNAVELTNATHPLIRFLTEVHRSHVAVPAPFAWGAASRLPCLPEVRFGRTILSPASWRLTRRDLGPDDGLGRLRRLVDWRCRYGVPRTVFLGSDDRRLRLDLDEPCHRQLLESELRRSGTVTLHEAPEDSVFGWLGRAHEIVMPFASALPPAPRPRTSAVLVRRESSRFPGVSPWAFLKVYCHPERSREILTAHLPVLFGDWEGGPPPWWFTRYQDATGSHLRLRLWLFAAGDFGEAVRRVGAWARPGPGQPHPVGHGRAGDRSVRHRAGSGGRRTGLRRGRGRRRRAASPRGTAGAVSGRRGRRLRRHRRRLHRRGREWFPLARRALHAHRRRGGTAPACTGGGVVLVVP
jgi:hypothetical protein